jgi:hypothetical protein
MAHTNDYDRAAQIITSVLEQASSAKVPDTIVPVALADFAIGIALRIGGSVAGEALVERMHKNVVEWSLGSHPMQEPMREGGEAVAEPQELFRKHEFDGSPIRIAMEHLLSHQRIKLEQAAVFFSVYALMLVFHNEGPDRAKALLGTARRELRRMETEREKKAAAGKSPAAGASGKRSAAGGGGWVH